MVFPSFHQSRAAVVSPRVLAVLPCSSSPSGKAVLTADVRSSAEVYIFGWDYDFDGAGVGLAPVWSFHRLLLLRWDVRWCPGSFESKLLHRAASKYRASAQVFCSVGQAMPGSIEATCVALDLWTRDAVTCDVRGDRSHCRSPYQGVLRRLCEPHQQEALHEADRWTDAARKVRLPGASTERVPCFEQGDHALNGKTSSSAAGAFARDVRPRVKVRNDGDALHRDDRGVPDHELTV